MTEIRRQYLRIKQSYPEAIVLFRLGDFYETFDEDAKLTSRLLEITLTAREMGKGQKIPMAGIPYHALDSYLAKLVGNGYKVAICEQLTPPGKGLIQRDVVRVVTPGTVIEPNLLQGKANNYLAAIVIEEEKAGIAYIDITTSEFATTQVSLLRATAELERLNPAELLIIKSEELPFSPAMPVTPVEEQNLEASRQLLLDHFGTASLEGYGCDQMPLAVKAAGAIIQYLQQTQKRSLDQIQRLGTYSTESFMLLDTQTRKNLELLTSSRGSAEGSLLSVLDLTKTAMGGRLLKKWISQPLLDLTELNQRLDSVDWLVSHAQARTSLIADLDKMPDLERLINRVRGYLATPRELVALRRGLEFIPELKSLLEGASQLEWLSGRIKPHPEIVALIAQSIADNPANPGEGTVIRPGFSTELDTLRQTGSSAKQYLANLEVQEKQRTGIKSLKVGYNRIFGYYIEISNPNLPQVPPDYVRKQTLSNAERFYTPELKEYESAVLNAQERIEELENTLFRQICQQVGAEAERILSLASALAQLDVLCALAETAARYGYVRPQTDNGDKIIIKDGRHPVVERFLEEAFVPNDTDLSNEDAQMLIITGPNMSGKSTYLRQVAIIVLMAQIGSFIPAQSANIGLVDRIFTRVGLRDDLVAGQSTFMVEMVETANILNNASRRSLIVLDEIGRGTSTYDGISIARAVAEYIHNHPQLGAKTLFATHYHELVDLAGMLPRVKNYNVAVSEEGGKVIFLRKILPGGADKSYGIHVAQLAGLPRSVINRAQQVLAELEGRAAASQDKRRRKAPAQQLPLMPTSSLIEEELAKLDIDSLTPLEAINKLYELKKKMEGNRFLSDRSGLSDKSD